MDAQQTFVAGQPSSPLQMLSPRVRAALEYMSLFIATTLFCFLVFMHVHYVKQPACSTEFSGFESTGAKLMLIKITSTDLWLPNESEPNRVNVPDLKTVAVQWLENRSMTFEPTYLYTTEKGYYLLPERAKSLHNIKSINISISARHSCLGNRWEQLLINRIVGYDTILINSLLSSVGQGFLYSYHAEQSYNLRLAQEPKKGLSRFTEKFVSKCSFLLMSFFVFFTTTMSASFILRDAQSRMLKLAVELQQHAVQGLPTMQLFLVNILEMLGFLPILIGIMLFMFEFYHDPRLAFMVLALVWPVQLFNIISVRTPISMKFFPLFFFMYFLVFHMYFFLYPNGFLHLALITTGGFTLHLILYFWNRFEVPELQRLMMQILGSRQIQGDVQILQSTIIASTVLIRRLDARDQGSGNTDPTEGRNAPVPREHIPGQADPDSDPDPDPNPRFMSLFRSLLSEGSASARNSLFSMFRGARGQEQAHAEEEEEEEVFSDAQE